MKFLCGSGPGDSAVELLARRLADALPQSVEVLAVNDGERPLVIADKRRTIAEHVHSLRNEVSDPAPILVMGLPHDSLEAQSVVELLVERDEGSALLWERAGHPIENVARGLHSVELVKNIYTLSTAHSATIRASARNARIERMSAAIPETFFRASTRSSVGDSEYAMFIGRSHPSKGARDLIDVWSRRVFPATRLPLDVYLVDASPRAIDEWTRPGVTVGHINGEEERARMAREARIVIFPAQYDHLPQALLEASAAGALVAATPIRGHAIDGESFAGLVLRHDLANIGELVQRSLSGSRELEAIRARASALSNRFHSVAAARQIMERLPT
ncbi:glycosyltransferase [Microbacterium sp. A1-JK]|uniref:glycosyltransferase n=1 Tax=Microbacterium sp. A1-JK TaxID=3177516 RepID=UPI003883E984